MNLLLALLINPILWGMWTLLATTNNNIEAFFFFFVACTWLGVTIFMVNDEAEFTDYIANYSEVQDVDEAKNDKTCTNN